MVIKTSILLYLSLLLGCSASHFTIDKLPITKSNLKLNGYYYFHTNALNQPNAVIGSYFFIPMEFFLTKIFILKI
jgi:hypothetical protein